MAQFMVMIETDEKVTQDSLLEGLCLLVFEGIPTDLNEAVKDIQVFGPVEKTLAYEDATDEQRAAVEGAVLAAHNKTN